MGYTISITTQLISIALATPILTWIVKRALERAHEKGWDIGHEQGWNDCLHEWNEQDKLPNQGRNPV